MLTFYANLVRKIIMYLFDSDCCGGSDWPISTVRPRRLARLEVSRRLEALEALNLNAQDRGFLQLAKAVFQVGEGSPSLPAEEWHQGLIS